MNLNLRFNWFCPLYAIMIIAGLLSEAFLLSNYSLSLVFKQACLVMLLLLWVARYKIRKADFIYYAFIACCLISLLSSYYLKAGVEELIRFCIPFLIFSISREIKDKKDFLLKLFFFIVITNNFYQLYEYCAYFLGLPTLHPFWFDSGLIMRAQGWIGMFSTFSFMNFVAFFILWFSRDSQLHKYKYVFLFFSFLGFSNKLYFAYGLFFLLMTDYKRVGLLILLLVLSAWLFDDVFNNILQIIDQKLFFYVTSSESVRSESYRVMLQSLSDVHFFGEGLGNFGGPSSIKNYSPLYFEYNFQWFTTDYLATTDTFFPHLFVEVGLIGSLLFLIYFSSSFQFKFRVKNPACFLYLSFLIENIASFAFTSFPYVYVGLSFLFILNDIQKNNLSVVKN